MQERLPQAELASQVFVSSRGSDFFAGKKNTKTWPLTPDCRSVISNATPHSHAPATNVCFGIYKPRYSVDAETSSA